MTLDTALRALPFVILVLQGLMGWFLWSLSQRFVTRDACGECHQEQTQRIAAVERMIAVAEVRNAAAITKGDIEKIYDRLNQVGNQVSEQGGEIRHLRRSVELINAHLLEKDR